MRHVVVAASTRMGLPHWHRSASMPKTLCSSSDHDSRRRWRGEPAESNSTGPACCDGSACAPECGANEVRGTRFDVASHFSGALPAFASIEPSMGTRWGMDLAVDADLSCTPIGNIARSASILRSRAPASMRSRPLALGARIP